MTDASGSVGIETTDTRPVPATGPGRAERRATLLILDGARPDVFRELLEAGDLPNVAEHVVETGGQVPATTVFPSTTGVAYLPFLTGCFPGTCGVPGIRWMDVSRYAGRPWRDRDHVRSYCGYQGGRLDDDLSPDVPTLFELEPDSVAVCSPVRRGLPAGRVRASGSRVFWGSVAHYTATYDPLDRAVGRALVEAAAERPRFTFGVFPGVDGVTHHRDPRHPDVLALYRAFDRDLGRWVEAGGLEGDHLLALVSDHGASVMERHEDLGRALSERGLSVLEHPALWRGDGDVAVMVSGNASAQLYLRPGRRRERRFSLSELDAGDVTGVPADLVDYLLDLPGVGLVAGTDGEDVVAASTGGRARIRRTEDDRLSYVPASDDVLDLGAEPRTLDPREWLEASLDGPYPDAPVQLEQLFRSRRTGDLVVSAAPGADLRDFWEAPEHRSGHGSLSADHMRCLAALNRPVRGPLRSVDLFPLILRHLGRAVRDDVDVSAETAASAELRR